MKRVLVVIVVGLALFGSARAIADTLDVTASIPYPIPSTAPVIMIPSNNFETSSGSIQLSGSCQIIPPLSVVSIWRDGLEIGSAPCTGNSFAITVGLISGANILLPRLSNYSGIFGPNGAEIRGTYTPIIPTQPEVVPGPNPTLASPITNSATLAVSSPVAFVQSTPGTDSISAQLYITGGATPFRISIKWGDGSTKLIEQAETTILLDHTYLQSGSYQVEVVVRDKDGNETIHILTVYVLGALSENSQKQTDTTTRVDGAERKSYTWVAWVAPIPVAFSAGIFLGLRNQPFVRLDRLEKPGKRRKR